MERIKSWLLLIGLLMTLVPICNGLYNSMFCEPNGISHPLLLRRTGLLSPNAKEALERVHNLTNIVLEQSNKESMLLGIREELRMQLRVMFGAFFAALLAAAFSSYKRSTQTKLGYILIALSTFMYILDCHYLDVIERTMPYHHALRNTLDTLVSLDPNDTTWYTLSNEEIYLKHANASEGKNRAISKFNRGFTPNLEQSLIFLVPLLFSLYQTRRWHSDTYAAAMGRPFRRMFDRLYRS